MDIECILENSDNKIFTAIGLMSGTSMDGIDAAIIKTDGEKIYEFGKSISLPYDETTKNEIRKAIEESIDTSQISKEITEVHAKAVNALLKEAGLKSQEVDILGFHGQTIKHDPEKGITVQIGDGKLLAELTGINVVNDLRRNDVKNGGQGAPLVPLFHKALLDKSKIDLPVAILNIGGVANVTYIDENTILAFDTGPGNALIDDWVLHNNAGSLDENGKLATKGDINEEILAKLINNPYFDKKPPKSLDRNEFSNHFINDLSLEDGAATLSVFTISSVIMADHHFPHKVKAWYVCGGGRHNSFIMDGLKTTLNNVHSIEELELDGDMIEAQAFAFLAVRSLRELPITLPSTTGVKQPLSGGILNVA